MISMKFWDKKNCGEIDLNVIRSYLSKNQQKIVLLNPLSLTNYERLLFCQNKRSILHIKQSQQQNRTLQTTIPFKK